MEEILASIRRIISDDDASKAEPKPRPADVRAPAPPPAASPPVARVPDPAPPARAVLEQEPEDEDVLDLAMAAAEVEAAAEPAIPASTGLDDIDFADDPPAPSPEPEPEPEPVLAAAPLPEPPRPRLDPPAFAARPAPEPRAATPDVSMLAPETEAAVSSAFGSLATAIFSTQPKTIEDLTKDLLKPMVKQWLDDNLPTLVERLVREEIERVARGRR
jgi:hypothetical protein